MYYFGYGSNMASRVMHSVCPDCERIGRAVLPDYRLAFTRESLRWGAAAADVLSALGQYVWGTLYQIDEKCLAALDEKESYGVGYDRMTVQVTRPDHNTYDAITYFVIPKLNPEGLPSLAYIDTIIEGAHEAQFPEEYMLFLFGIKEKIR